MAEPQRRTDAEPHVAADDRFLIVEGRFYDDIGDRLLAGAKAALDAAGATYDVVTMPGALEVPPAIAIAIDGAAAAGRPYGGAVALGCIMRGETYHFEVVSNESARGLMDLAIARRLPLGNGILTVEDADQALARAAPSRGDKGGEAARAMLALWRLKARPADAGAAT
jgi:6,7-dimethyl-8-ribityllumazine synthase